MKLFSNAQFLWDRYLIRRSHIYRWTVYLSFSHIILTFLIFLLVLSSSALKIIHIFSLFPKVQDLLCSSDFRSFHLSIVHPCSILFKILKRRIDLRAIFLLFKAGIPRGLVVCHGLPWRLTTNFYALWDQDDLLARNSFSKIVDKLLRVKESFVTSRFALLDRPTRQYLKSYDFLLFPIVKNGKQASKNSCLCSIICYFAWENFKNAEETSVMIVNVSL